MSFQPDKPLFPNTTAHQEEGDLFADFKPSQQYGDQDLFAEPASSKIASEDNILRDEKGPVATIKFSPEKWKILMVDDETDIHEITALVLGNYVYQNKSLELMSAYSAQQAKTVLEQHHDIAIIFLDVVMESHDAGLQLVRYVRKELGNPFVRIILRTGQPGYAPEEKVIIDYEINEYVNKTELTRQKLITLTTASLRSYGDLMTVELYRQQLEQKVNQRTQELQEKNQKLTFFNDQLFSLNKDKNEFLGVAAHDLKNPLSGILGLSEEISSSFDDHSKAEIIEYANMISISAKQMFSLVTNLLDVNAIESRKLNILLKPVDVLPIVQSLVKFYMKLALSKQITISFQETDSEYIVLADKNMIHQVLDNLISNAVKYSPFNTKIHIRINKEKGEVSCEIQDEGPGLSAADQQKLFRKFTRLTARPTGGEHSTGLGLFIVKKLVEVMKGKVRCHSQLGKGTVFTVTFPEH